MKRILFLIGLLSGVSLNAGFLAGTQVAIPTDDGGYTLIPIETIKKGDVLLGMDPDKGLIPVIVNQVAHAPVSYFMTLTIVDPIYGDYTIKSDYGQRYCEYDGDTLKAVKAQDLGKGAILEALGSRNRFTNNTSVLKYKVTNIKKDSYWFSSPEAYFLDVIPTHNYYVSTYHDNRDELMNRVSIQSEDGEISNFTSRDELLKTKDILERAGGLTQELVMKLSRPNPHFRMPLLVHNAIPVAQCQFSTGAGEAVNGAFNIVRSLGQVSPVIAVGVGVVVSTVARTINILSKQEIKHSQNDIREVMREEDYRFQQDQADLSYRFCRGSDHSTDGIIEIDGEYCPQINGVILWKGKYYNAQDAQWHKDYYLRKNMERERNHGRRDYPLGIHTTSSRKKAEREALRNERIERERKISEFIERSTAEGHDPLTISNSINDGSYRMYENNNNLDVTYTPYEQQYEATYNPYGAIATEIGDVDNIGNLTVYDIATMDATNTSTTNKGGPLFPDGVDSIPTSTQSLVDGGNPGLGDIVTTFFPIRQPYSTMVKTVLNEFDSDELREYAKEKSIEAGNEMDELSREIMQEKMTKEIKQKLEKEFLDELRESSARREQELRQSMYKIDKLYEDRNDRSYMNDRKEIKYSIPYIPAEKKTYERMSKEVKRELIDKNRSYMRDSISRRYENQ